ncbi:MAG: phage portal protein [Patescibacteria group bacterium]|nr:phage portal protein [Patescibacteria group bacterium]
MARRFSLERFRGPVPTGLELAGHAVKVAQDPTALSQVDPKHRQKVDEIATAIKVSSHWSTPSAASGTVAQRVQARPVSAEVVSRRAVDALNPNSGVVPADIQAAMRNQGIDWVQPFTPGEPLRPYYGYEARPRMRDYKVGRNVTTDTRPDRIPFETLRHLVSAYDVAQICYRHAIQDLRSMRVRFEVMDGHRKNATKEIARAKQFMRRPDGRLTFRNWLCKHATDVWRFDAGTIYRERDRAGNLTKLHIADGTLFAPILDYFGNIPTGDAPAYQQFIQGIPWDWLNASDIIYEPMWPHTEDPYGIAPIETILVNANTDMRLQMYFLQFFTEGNVPEAFAVAPPDQSDPEALADWQEKYNAWTYGDQRERWGLRWLPAETKLEFYKPQGFDPNVAEYVMRRTVSAFMMVPHDLGFTSDVNRSTGDTQMDTQFRINSLPHCGYYEDIIDSILQDDLGLPVQMRFDTGREKEDRLMEAQAHQIYVQIGAESPDEVREKVLGYAINPDEKTPRAFFDQRLGLLPLSYLQSISGNVDPLTGAPVPGSVKPRELVLPGVPPMPGEAGAQDAQPTPTPTGPGTRKPTSARATSPRGTQRPANRTLKEATSGISTETGIAGAPDVDGPDDDEDEAVRDLARWRAQSRKRVAKGQRPRQFLGSQIPPTVYEAVWKGLGAASTREEVDAAFLKAQEVDLIAAGVALVARDSGRVLMVQRGNKDDSGQGSRWEFPAGHIEPGESPLEGAIREWEEETGAKFPSQAIQVGTWTDEDGEFQGFVYKIDREDQVTLGTADGDEIAAIAWWDIDDLDADEMRDKVHDQMGSIEPILDQAEKQLPKVLRPGSAGPRELALVTHYTPQVQAALNAQANPNQIAQQYANYTGNTPPTRPPMPAVPTGIPGVGAIGGAGTRAIQGAGVAATFAASLSLVTAELMTVIGMIWAASWLAGAKSAEDNGRERGTEFAESDSLVRRIAQEDWDTWTPEVAPELSSLPGSVQISSEIASLVSEITDTTRKAIASAVERFVGTRTGPVAWSNADVAELADEIAAMLDNPSRAAMIARTEVNRAMTQGAVALYRRANVEMFDLLNHSGACPVCVAVHDANPHPMSDAAAMPPIHPNCLVGTTRVVVPGDVIVGKALGHRATPVGDVRGASAPTLAETEGNFGRCNIRAATEREYVGDVITIRTSLGYELTATPNHPIATPNGWVAISELSEGHDILSSRSREWIVDSVYPDVDDIPPMIQEVAKSFAVSFGAMPSAPEDFHGDGSGSNVYVVRTDCLLGNDPSTGFSEPLCHDGLGRRDIGAAELDTDSLALQLSHSSASSASGVVGSFGERGTSSGVKGRHTDVHSVTPVTGDNAIFEQDPPNGPAVDALGFCQRLLAHAPDITLDKIVRIRRYPFAGQVFNLDTVDGWYIGNGIVTHNCRCELVPTVETP